MVCVIRLTFNVAQVLLKLIYGAAFNSKLKDLSKVLCLLYYLNLALSSGF